MAEGADHLISIDTKYSSGDYTLVDVDVATALENLKTMRTFKANVNKIKFFDTDLNNPVEITFSNYELTVNPMNIVFDAYTVSDKTNTVKTNTENYTKALWIIEHTYPSVSISKALSDAGASYDELKTQIATLYSLTDQDEIASAVENVVYGVIQYAIWSVTGTGPTGKVYTGVQNNENLDKLFKYLVDADRVIPTNYATGMSFSNRISVVTPEDGKEEASSDDNKVTYGPYSATYNALDGGNLEVSVTTDDAEGIKIVDKDGNEITEVEPGQEFYVQIPKKEKLGNVTIELGTTISKFDPEGLRGRIYQPVFILGQNVMSGGKIVTANINTSFDIVINAKTGVEDIAVLLMVTLVAFSLGYLVLSYKAKPVELS